MQFRLFSIDYLAHESDHDISVGYIHESVLLRKLEQLECTRLFACVSFQNWEPQYIALNLTTDRDAERDGLYLPHWMIPSVCGVEDDTVEVEFLSDEAFPEATHICLRPLDSAFYSIDVREHLSGCLSRLGIVQAGSVVNMRLEELGGYEMGFYVVRCEPASLVLCSGDEVAIEFEEASDLWDGRRSPTPVPMDEPMIPVTPPPTPQGHVLGGGAPNRRMPDGRAWNPWRLPREGSNV